MKKKNRALLDRWLHITIELAKAAADEAADPDDTGDIMRAMLTHGSIVFEKLSRDDGLTRAEYEWLAEFALRILRNLHDKVPGMVIVKKDADAKKEVS